MFWVYHQSNTIINRTFIRHNLRVLHLDTMFTSPFCAKSFANNYNVSQFTISIVKMYVEHLGYRPLHDLNCAAKRF